MRRPGRRTDEPAGARGDTSVQRVLGAASRPHRPAVPFTARRRRPARGGPVVVGLVLLAAFVGAAFAVGYLVGSMLL